MSLTQKPAKKNQRRRGNITVDVPVQSTASRSFLATIDATKKDGDKFIGANGIVWNVGKQAI